MNRMACRANSFLKLGRVGYSCEHDEIVLHDVGHVFNVLAPHVRKCAGVTRKGLPYRHLD